MASRQSQFFIRRSEFLNLLAEVSSRHSLFYIIYDAKYQEMQSVLVDDLRLTQKRRVYIADGPLTDAIAVEAKRRRGPVPAKWRWIVADLPQEKDDVLYMAEISCRSSWIDDHGEEREESAVLDLYSKVFSTLKTQLTGPMWAGSRTTKVWRRYPNLRYSPGAASWHRSGGQLRQLGVANTEFDLMEPPTR